MRSNLQRAILQKICWFSCDLIDPILRSKKIDLKSPSTTIKCELDSTKVSKLRSNMHSMQKVWISPLLLTTSLYGLPSFLSFLWDHAFDHIFLTIRPNEIRDKHQKTPWGKVISSCLEGYKTTLHTFLKKNTFSNTRLAFVSKE